MNGHATTTGIVPTDEAPDAEKPRRRWVGWVVTGAWAANCVMLVGACLWLLMDGNLYRALSGQVPKLRGIDWLLGAALSKFGVGLGRGILLDILQTAALVVATSLVVMFCGLIFGTPRQRRMRSWLALTGLVAGWLMVLTAWETLAWAGQRWRVAPQIAEFEPVAALLRENWPSHDASLEPVGPFSAYPDGQPRVLLPLTTAESRVGVAPFSAIERSDAGGLRFELVGPEAGSWLEWHPVGEEPASFVGGLETRYELLRWNALSEGWHLARYRVEGVKHAE